MQSQNPFHDDLVVGIPAIDAEHQQLFGELNRLSRDPSGMASVEFFFEGLSRIGQKITEHFRHEEALFEHCGIDRDEISAHVAAHNRIVEQFTELQLDLMTGACMDRAATLGMLRSWIVTHLLAYDLKIKPLAEQGVPPR